MLGGFTPSLLFFIWLNLKKKKLTYSAQTSSLPSVCNFCSVQERTATVSRNLQGLEESHVPHSASQNLQSCKGPTRIPDLKWLAHTGTQPVTLVSLAAGLSAKPGLKCLLRAILTKKLMNDNRCNRIWEDTEKFRDICKDWHF